MLPWLRTSGNEGKGAVVPADGEGVALRRRDDRAPSGGGALHDRAGRLAFSCGSSPTARLEARSARGRLFARRAGVDALETEGR